MRGKWRFAAVAVSAMVLLSGCATQAELQAKQEAEIERVSRYDTAHSYAWNLGKMIVPEEDIRDTYVEDSKLVNSPLHLSNMEFWAISNAIVWDPTSIGNLLLIFAPEKPHLLKSVNFIGFLSKKDYPNELDARAKFRMDLMAAWEQAMTKAGFSKKKEKTPITYLEMQKPDNRKIYAYIGMPYIYPRHAVGMTMPKWIDSSGEEVWAIGAIPAEPYYLDAFEVSLTPGLDLSSEAMGQKRAAKIDLLKRFARELPDHHFVYVPAMRDAQGDWNPPYFANNKQRFDFVMPKSAETKN